MEGLFETVVNALMSELEENYEGDRFELLEELEEKLKGYNNSKEAAKDVKLNYLLSQIIEDCPELYAQHWSSLKDTLVYHEAAIQSY